MIKRIALSLLAALALAACAADDAPIDESSSAVSAVALPDAGADDLRVICTRRETLPCGYLLGRTLYCSMCVCEELEGCHGDPTCATCSGGF